MDFTTIINIAQYVLSALVLPALWFIVKLYNTVSMQSKDITANKEALARFELLQKEQEAKREEKESRREEWERTIYKAIIEQNKDIHYIKEKLI